MAAANRLQNQSAPSRIQMMPIPVADSVPDALVRQDERMSKGEHTAESSACNAVGLVNLA